MHVNSSIEPYREVLFRFTAQKTVEYTFLIMALNGWFFNIFIDEMQKNQIKCLVINFFILPV
jgi:hypothetical protein